MAQTPTTQPSKTSHRARGAVYELYSTGPVEDIDLITASIPYPVLRDSYQWLTKKTTMLDHDLLTKLNAAGFETDNGPDETGFHMKYLRTGVATTSTWAVPT